MRQLQRLGAGSFAISGALGLATVTALRRDGIHQFAADTGTLNVDLSAVTSADSAGLALLVDWLAWAARSGRELHYQSMPAQLQALARISDVSSLMEPAHQPL
jgi:phospholipid transport system transporter-binding protein